MLQRITERTQVQTIYSEFTLETNWYWWIEGAYPDYPRFENWVRGCDQDSIGFFVHTTSVQSNLLGFSRFSNSNTMHGFSYLTIWVKPSIRNRGLMPYGFILAAEAINFAFRNYPLRKIYQNVLVNNLVSLGPLQKVAQREGTLENHYFFDGEYQDLAIFSIDRETWTKLFSRYESLFERYLKLSRQ